ncbi:hypothetical protein JNUCC0626_20130 [Lentzea sp. JNUCC 0626]|uniref:hypothetical protein n=1 Tax=Lentzea sp. JNUCC 0626 TaxID=3367513 RepID=UPI003747CB93
MHVGSTTVRLCICTNEFQDQTYGHRRRVFNVGPNRLTCSSCGRKEIRPKTDPAKDKTNG